MPSPTLLLGPAASGKTQVCLARARSRLSAQPLAPVWILLPDRHQTAAIRGRLAGEGGALGVRVSTFGDLYAEVLALADRPTPVAPEPVLHRLIRAAIDAQAEQGELRHYLRIRQRPGLTLSLSDLIAELKRGRITPEQFKGAVAGSGPRLEELAALYERYQNNLIRLDWADPEGLGWLAILQMQADAALAASWHVFVDGFDSYTLTQLEALDLLAARAASLTLTLTGAADMGRAAHRRFRTTRDALRQRFALSIELLTTPPARTRPLAHLEGALFEAASTRVPPAGRVHFVEAQTQALEAREALRWLKARIVRDEVPAEGCAVITRDLSAYEPFLREAAREFGLPVFFAGGEPLSRNPAIAAIVNLLELPLQNWGRRPVLDAVRTPYFDLGPFGLASTDAVRLEGAARWGQVIGGLDQWREALERLAHRPAGATGEEDDGSQPPALPAGEAARRLGAALEQLAARLTPPESTALKDGVAWLEALLADLGLAERAAGEPETAARDQAALEVFRDILRALVLSDEIVGRASTVSFAEFYTQLRGGIAAAAYAPDTPGRRGAIYAASLHLARGVSYDAVAVLGLSEGLFPAPLTEDPLISDDEREALNARGLALEKRLRGDQQSLFYEAVTRAEKHLLLTRPCLAGDGEAWEPSPYWSAALALFETGPQSAQPGHSRPLTDAASAQEVMEGAMRRGSLPDAFRAFDDVWQTLQHAGRVLAARLAPGPAGPFEGGLGDLAGTLGARYGGEHVWSASRLEAYQACGFLFYIHAALELEPHQPPEPGLDAAQRGRLIHRILERVYQAADPADVEALAAVLPLVARPIFDDAPRDLGFRPTPLWPAEQAELLAALESTIRRLADVSEDWRPIRFEERFDSLALPTPAGTVRLRGKIDRVDQNADGQVRVIDYKTGAAGLDKPSLIRGGRLQLPLYAAAAESALSLGEALDGFYWAVMKGEAGSLKLQKFHHAPEAGAAYAGVAGALRLAGEHIGQAVLGIRAGEFPPVPPDGGCPDYCPAKDFCWRYAPGW